MGPSSLPAEPDPVVFVTPQLATNKAAAVADNVVASLAVVNIVTSPCFRRSTTCLFGWSCLSRTALVSTPKKVLFAFCRGVLARLLPGGRRHVRHRSRLRFRLSRACFQAFVRRKEGCVVGGRSACTAR